MMKLKNLNINEGLIKRIGALVLVGSMFATMVGCSSKKTTVDIPVSVTISSTLDSVSDLTTMDELLNEDVFVNNSNGQEYTFDELLEAYNVARQQQNLSECNTVLYKIGRMIMKAQFAEALNIKPEQITSMSIDGITGGGHTRISTVTYKTKSTETVSGNIELDEEEIITRDFVTVGEMDNLAINIERACNHALDFDNNSSYMDLNVDNVYESFIEQILTTPSIGKVEVVFGDDYYTIDASLSQEKIDAFNASSSAPSKSLNH